jgi:hypothetical protein
MNRSALGNSSQQITGSVGQVPSEQAWVEGGGQLPEALQVFPPVTPARSRWASVSRLRVSFFGILFFIGISFRRLPSLSKVFPKDRNAP